MRKIVLKEYRNIWKISMPVILSLLAQNIVSMTDTAFLGRVGETELGASAIAGLYYFCFYMVGFGFGIGLQIFISRRKGESENKAIGIIVDNGAYFLFFLALVFVIISLSFASSFFKISVTSQEIIKQSTVFLKYRIWGLFFTFINVVFRSFYVGITKTRHLAYNAILMSVSNILLDYVLIFGHFGFPSMGLAGAAIASVLSEFIATITFVSVTFKNKKYFIYNLFGFSKINFKLIFDILKISFYTMLQFFVSLAGWFAFFLIIEKTGERSLAISNVIRNIYMFLMIPVWGYCSAVSSLVSIKMGENKPDDVILVVKKTTVISIISTSLLIVIVAIFPVFTLSIFNNDISFINDGKASLYVVLGATLLFSAVMIPFNAVSGTANTNIALFIEIFSIIIYLLTAYYLEVCYAKPEIIWFSEYVYYIITGGFSIIYLWKGNWRTKKI